MSAWELLQLSLKKDSDFTVVCSVTWRLTGSEAAGDLAYSDKDLAAFVV